MRNLMTLAFTSTFTSTFFRYLHYIHYSAFYYWQLNLNTVPFSKARYPSRMLPAQTNPYLVANTVYTREQTNLIRYAHKFHMVGVHARNKLFPDDFQEVAIFCRINHIDFRYEEFSDGVYEDAEFILKLPAVQIYYENEYEKTMYLEEDIAKVIQGILQEIKGQIAVTKKSWTRWLSDLIPVRGKRKVKVGVVGSVPS